MVPAPSTSQQAQPALQANQPLVSIVIPTHDRPDYLTLALDSAQTQTYQNLQIVISDNSGNDLAREAIADRLAADPRIVFTTQTGGGFMENWFNALSHATGDYVNFLMDDDLFAPTKVERMVNYFTQYPSVRLVTSFRQLIDADGKPMAALPGTQRLFENDTVLAGTSMSEFILKAGMNLIGEPTTAMYRRQDVGAGLGRFCDKQYSVLIDLSTWMEVMHGHHCVYIAEPLSFFRIHGGQDQRKTGTALRANLEWLQLLLDGHESGRFFADKVAFREVLAGKLQALMPHLASHREDLRDNDFDTEHILALTRRAMRLLLQ
ncbi:MAG TPA: glycosyltransferase family 2 protein [Burkholderiaceae bacterium]|jgi:glycosyltransferase involved in cell wall biosynthesis